MVERGSCQKLLKPFYRRMGALAFSVGKGIKDETRGENGRNDVAQSMVDDPVPKIRSPCFPCFWIPYDEGRYLPWLISERLKLKLQIK